MKKPVDKDLALLTGALINHLADTILSIQSLLEAKDWEGIAQQANRAAGDAGLHALHDISSEMRCLESAAHQQNQSKAVDSLRKLQCMVAQVAEG